MHCFCFGQVHIDENFHHLFRGERTGRRFFPFHTRNGKAHKQGNKKSFHEKRVRYTSPGKRAGETSVTVPGVPANIPPNPYLPRKRWAGSNSVVEYLLPGPTAWA